MTTLEIAQEHYDALENQLNGCLRWKPNLPFVQLSNEVQAAWEEVKRLEAELDARIEEAGGMAA